MQSQHVHGSTLDELSDGGLLAAWFQGSGERQADDVAIYGAGYEKVARSHYPSVVQDRTGKIHLVYS